MHVYNFSDSTYTSINTGLAGTIYSVCSYNGDLYCGNDAGTLYKYNGSSWNAFITVTGDVQDIIDMEVANGLLFVVGSFDRATCNGKTIVAKMWIVTDGINIAPVLQGGIDRRPEEINNMSEWGDILVVNGDLESADGIDFNTVFKYEIP
jgi:hypothetical protein